MYKSKKQKYNYKSTSMSGSRSWSGIGLRNMSSSGSCYWSDSYSGVKREDGSWPRSRSYSWSRSGIGKKK